MQVAVFIDHAQRHARALRNERGRDADQRHAGQADRFRLTRMPGEVARAGRGRHQRRIDIERRRLRPRALHAAEPSVGVDAFVLAGQQVIAAGAQRRPEVPSRQRQARHRVPDLGHRVAAAPLVAPVHRDVPLAEEALAEVLPELLRRGAARTLGALALREEEAQHLVGLAAPRVGRLVGLVALDAGADDHAARPARVVRVPVADTAAQRGVEGRFAGAQRDAAEHAQAQALRGTLVDAHEDLAAVGRGADLEERVPPAQRLEARPHREADHGLEVLHVQRLVGVQAVGRAIEVADVVAQRRGVDDFGQRRLDVAARGARRADGAAGVEVPHPGQERFGAGAGRVAGSGRPDRRRLLKPAGECLQVQPLQLGQGRMVLHAGGIEAQPRGEHGRGGRDRGAVLARGLPFDRDSRLPGDMAPARQALLAQQQFRAPGARQHAPARQGAETGRSGTERLAERLLKPLGFGGRQPQVGPARGEGGGVQRRLLHAHQAAGIEGRARLGRPALGAADPGGEFGHARLRAGQRRAGTAIAIAAAPGDVGRYLGGVVDLGRRGHRIGVQLGRAQQCVGGVRPPRRVLGGSGAGRLDVRGGLQEGPQALALHLAGFAGRAQARVRAQADQSLEPAAGGAQQQRRAPGVVMDAVGRAFRASRAFHAFHAFHSGRACGGRLGPVEGRWTESANERRHDRHLAQALERREGRVRIAARGGGQGACDLERWTEWPGGGELRGRLGAGQQRVDQSLERWRLRRFLGATREQRGRGRREIRGAGNHPHGRLRHVRRGPRRADDRAWRTCPFRRTRRRPSARCAESAGSARAGLGSGMQPVHERGRALLDPLRGRRAELGAGGELDRGAWRRRHPQRRDRGAEIEGPRGDARRTGSELALELVQEAAFRGMRGGGGGWGDRRGGRGRVVGADGWRERSPGSTGNCHGVASLSGTPAGPAREREAGAAPAKPSAIPHQLVSTPYPSPTNSARAEITRQQPVAAPFTCCTNDGVLDEPPRHHPASAASG